jgi:hypothetical protein
LVLLVGALGGTAAAGRRRVDYAGGHGRRVSGHVVDAHAQVTRTYTNPQKIK